ncbi:MAG: amino acid permease, partial [Chitinophagaceae bacterium]
MSAYNEFGYRVELSRSMGSFSSFAISFSLISVLTGLFANFNYGYQQAGDAIFWMWLLVAIGQFLAALVMANLSRRFPIAGYGYQWAARLLNTDFGFFVGWFLLLQFITGFPGICQTFTVTFLGIVGITVSPSWLVAGTILVISTVVFTHWFGIRYAAKVNDWGVYAELFGVLFLILLLAIVWVAGKNFSIDHLINTVANVQSFSRPFNSLALSLLV